MNVTPPVTCGNYAIMERPRGAGNTDRGLTHQLDLGERGLAVKATRICTIEDCEKPLVAQGRCSTHYAAGRRTGELAVNRKYPREPLHVRLARLIDQSAGPDGCWLWMGAHNESGYGLTHTFDGSRRKTIGAHRAAYEAAVGPIPKGMYILHQCHNPSCCNPAHLRPGTHRENMADRQEHGATKPNGSWSPRAPRVDEETLAAIRSAYRFGVRGHTIRAVGARFGLSSDIIWQIVNYRGRWAESA